MTDQMNVVQYLFANKGLGMSAGKMAAQIAHASVLGLVGTTTPKFPDVWLASGYTKLVMEARDESHLRNIREYLKEKGFNSFPIIDEGRTEVAPQTFTALGVELVDKNDSHVQFAFGDFVLYKEPKVIYPPPTWLERFLAGGKKGR